MQKANAFCDITGKFFHGSNFFDMRKCRLWANLLGITQNIIGTEDKTLASDNVKGASRHFSSCLLLRGAPNWSFVGQIQ